MPLKTLIDLAKIGIRDPKFAGQYATEAVKEVAKSGMPRLAGAAKIAGFGLPVIGAGLDFASGMSEGEDVQRAAAGAVGSAALGTLGAMVPIPGVNVLTALGGAALGGWLGDRADEVMRGNAGLSADRKMKDLNQQRQQALAAGNMIQASEIEKQQKSILEANGIGKQEDALDTSLQQYGRIADFKRQQAQQDFNQDEANARESIRFRTGNQALGEFLRSQDDSRKMMLQGAMNFKY